MSIVEFYRGSSRNFVLLIWSKYNGPHRNHIIQKLKETWAATGACYKGAEGFIRPVAEKVPTLAAKNIAASIARKIEEEKAYNDERIRRAAIPPKKAPAKKVACKIAKEKAYAAEREKTIAIRNARRRFLSLEN